MSCTLSPARPLDGRHTLLQPHYKLRFNVRPIRHSYFVREGDVERLERAIHLICTQWGGLYSLLIPVRADGSIYPYFEALLRQHQPDRFVEYVTAPSASVEDADEHYDDDHNR